MNDTIPKPDTIRNRLLVNVLGIPALVALIWFGGLAYAAFICVFVALGLREYFRLLRRGNLTPRDIPGYLAAAIILVAIILAARQPGNNMAGLAQVFMLTMIALVMTLQAIEVFRDTPTSWTNISTTVVGVVWIAVFGGSFILVRAADFSAYAIPADVAFRYTMSLYLAVWLCDSMAYVFGKAFGKARIAPNVSPNKTIVGTAAGFISAIVLMLAFGLGGFLPAAVFSWVDLILLGVITGGFGQLGDFVESRLKRDYGVKDSSNLLPGHGGALDRFDSLLFVMPLGYIYFLLMIAR